MQLVNVTNNGKKIINRLGVSIKPSETKELKVTPRQLLVVQAVRSFTVEKVGNEEKDPALNQNEGQNAELADEEIQALQKKNIEDFKAEVVERELDLDKAIEIEEAGKGRSSLIEELEGLKEESGD